MSKLSQKEKAAQPPVPLPVVISLHAAVVGGDDFACRGIDDIDVALVDIRALGNLARVLSGVVEVEEGETHAAAIEVPIGDVEGNFVEYRHFFVSPFLFFCKYYTTNCLICQVKNLDVIRLKRNWTS